MAGDCHPEITDTHVLQEFKFWFWVVLLGPIGLTAVLVAVEGFPMPWGTAMRRYLAILIHSLVYASACWACLLWMRARGIRLNWFVAGAGYLILMALCSVLAMALSVASGLKPVTEWPMGMLRSITMGIAVMPIFLLLERLYHVAVVTGLESKRRELEREREQRVALEAQWLSLESRVRPHFLFNTLSSIRELMHRSVPEADLMIQRFANLIRFSLDSGRNALVPLQEELQTVSSYLEIEKMRLGARLSWDVSVEPECRSLPVPSLSILTLVENSVKHVAAHRRSGGAVTVDAAIQNGRLRIVVRDDGPGFDESAIVAGHGLDLLAQRLSNLYQGRASLILTPSAAGAAAVTLVIPTANGQTPLLPYR